MHLMITKTKYKNKEKSYAKIVQTYFDGKTSRQKVLLNLGPINSKKDMQKFKELLNSMRQKSEFVDIKNITIENTKEFGVTYLFKKLLEKYGLNKIFEKYLLNNKAKFDVCEIFKALIISRLLRPSSDLSTSDWINKNYIKELNVDEQHLYRTLDYLIPYKEQIENEVFTILKKKLNLDTKKTYYDLTSSYFEGQKCEIAMFGYSRDHRRDRKQIVIGLVMCDGIPVMHEVHEGNTADKMTMISLQEQIKKRLGIKKTTILADGGLMTEENIQSLEDSKLGYIMACPRRNNKMAKELLVKVLTSEKKQYAKELHKVEIKRNEKTHTRRYILCLDNNTRRERLLQLDKIKKELIESLTKMQEKYEKNKKSKKGKKITKDSLMLQASNMLKKNKGLFNLEFKSGLVFSVNKKALDYEKKIAGKFLLVTNINMEANEMMKSYKELQVVENAFDNMKNFLDIRPIYHRKERRVKAHVFICVLAFLIECIIEKFVKQTARMTIRELETIKVTKISALHTQKMLITKLSKEVLAIFKQLKINKPVVIEN